MTLAEARAQRAANRRAVRTAKGEEARLCEELEMIYVVLIHKLAR